MILRLLFAAILIAASVFAYKSWAINNAFAILAEAPLGNSTGPEDAKITLIEIADYRCSFCRAVHPVIQDLQKRNPDLRIVYRHLPVFQEASLHEAQLALSAGMQGHFEEVHNKLMENEAPMDDGYVERTARELSVDYDKFMKDLKGPEIGEMLLGTLDAIEILGINSTPSFIVNKIIFRPDSGVPTVEELEKFIADSSKK